MNKHPKSVPYRIVCFETWISDNLFFIWFGKSASWNIFGGVLLWKQRKNNTRFDSLQLMHCFSFSTSSVKRKFGLRMEWHLITRQGFHFEYCILWIAPFLIFWERPGTVCPIRSFPKFRRADITKHGASRNVPSAGHEFSYTQISFVPFSDFEPLLYSRSMPSALKKFPFSTEQKFIVDWNA